MANTHPPAPGILASTLLAGAQSREKFFGQSASSGSPSIDLALKGGFRYGEVTSIAGATGSSKTLLAFHAVASHLLENKHGQVALIDTTGSFRPLSLRNVLVQRLEQQSLRMQVRQVASVEGRLLVETDAYSNGSAEQAELMLGRAKIMRVFDLVGVVEAMGEINQTWEEDDQQIENLKIKASAEEGQEFVDSEDGASSCFNDDNYRTVIPAGADAIPSRSDVYADRVGMIIIDTIANVVSSIMSQNQVQGQAFLSSFMRSLRQSAMRQQTCVVLINAVVGLNPSKSPYYSGKPRDDASGFASAQGKPSLGINFAHLIDTSILLSSLPTTKHDAEVALGEETETKEWSKVDVVEILRDKYDTREGRWAILMEPKLPGSNQSERISQSMTDIDSTWQL